MAHKPKAIVLDSWSIIAYLEDEPAGQQVADLIAEAHENSTPLMMTVINAGEVWYILAREDSIAEAEQSLAELRGLRIEFVEADWKLTRAAAGFKAKCKMSYADCFAAALAKEHKAELVTGDPEFKQVEGEVKILWV
jgi:predicted nucleic acid-binding protein